MISNPETLKVTFLLHPVYEMILLKDGKLRNKEDSTEEKPTSEDSNETNEGTTQDELDEISDYDVAESQMKTTTETTTETEIESQNQR